MITRQEASQPVENCNNREPTQEICEMCTARHLCPDSVCEKESYERHLYEQLKFINESMFGVEL